MYGVASSLRSQLALLAARQIAYIATYIIHSNLHYSTQLFLLARRSYGQRPEGEKAALRHAEHAGGGPRDGAACKGRSVVFTIFLPKKEGMMQIQI